MDQKRKGEIALLIVRAIIRENMTQLFPRDVRERITEMAGKTGLECEEVSDFAKEELEIMSREFIKNI